MTRQEAMAGYLETLAVGQRMVEAGNFIEGIIQFENAIAWGDQTGLFIDYADNPSRGFGGDHLPQISPKRDASPKLDGRLVVTMDSARSGEMGGRGD